MVTLQLQPPAAFQFSKPEEWRKWKSRFERYRLASGLSEASEERQVSGLMYCMGEDAEDILSTTNISEEHKKVYSRVLSKFDEYFGVRKNLVFERATFNQARQLSDETAEHFITRLHRLSDNCEFGELKADMIRDRLVIGIRDLQLSERLQLEPDLTLQRAEKLIRQRQAVKEQQVILKQPANLAIPQQIDRVTRPKPPASRKQYQRRPPQIQRQPSTQPSWQKCKRC